MTMTSYLLTAAADADLDEIWTFIAADRRAEVADRVEGEIHAAMLRLAAAPGIGHLRTDLADEPLRFFAAHRFLVIYRPQADPIQVVRVLHGSRDVRAILADDPPPQPKAHGCRGRGPVRRGGGPRVGLRALRGPPRT